ncbi:hypothetical protein GVS35_09830 [Escherichia coli]|nr:hypothetical protein [Escherichia coli]EFH2696141.1 hypothetical protein [Escherichia coli]EFH3037678.1 hypothetical protein [Escherichia coli]EFH4458057.1 hypothetical protein [Escherichia coli]EFH6008786.1 hypothetical protein [Escherichia coli]
MSSYVVCRNQRRHLLQWRSCCFLRISGTAASAGAHAHTVGIGAHTHSVAIGSHGHTITVNAAGNAENTVKNIAFNYIVRLA